MTQLLPHPGSAADAAWAKVRAMGDIQFAPLSPEPPPPPAPPPAWLRALSEWLAKCFGPIGQWLAQHWRAIEIGTVIVAALALAWGIWSVWQNRARKARQVDADETAHWHPGAAVASALLADADQKAAAGRFDEAVHLIAAEVERSRYALDPLGHPDWARARAAYAAFAVPQRGVAA